MIKWNPTWVRLALVVGAIASFAVASGAGLRWT
jgi:hypothetical protein